MSEPNVSNPGFHIRPAVEGDIDTILRLITDLAIYEKEPDAVKATPDLLRQTLFTTPYAYCLLAFLDAKEEEGTREGKAIGLALYFFNYSTWLGRPGLYLEDLFVDPNYRNLGLGKKLFGQLGKIAEEKGCGRIDWSVLKWNTPSIKFYESALGATAMSEWEGMRLEGEDAIQRLRKFI